MKLIIIAALTRDRVIGKGGKVPWHIPEDLKRFKELTTGHTVLMGRKTYESIGRALPNRRNIVLSSNPIPGVESYDSLEKALAALKESGKVFVIGGGKVFAQLLPLAGELYLTLVEENVEGDTFFPPYEELLKSDFKLTGSEKREGLTFLHYQKMPR